MKGRITAAVGIAVLLAVGASVAGFAATLGVDSGTIDTFAANQQATTTTSTTSTTTTTAPGDTTPPQLTLLKMFDVNGNGKVDQVKATFDETLAPYSAGTAPWSLASVPSGGTLSSVSVSGAVATLTIAEGSSAANTAVGSFTVALATNTNGIRDAAGNRSSFVATAPTDGAAPIPVSLSMANGGTAGTPDKDDMQTVVFSEALDPGSICPGKAVDFDLAANDDLVSAVLTDAAPESLTFSSASACSSLLSVGTITLGTANYLSSGSRTFSGNGSNRTEVSWTSALRQLRLTLGSRSSGTTNTVTSSQTATYSPASSMTDPAGNPAHGSVTFTGVQF